MPRVNWTLDERTIRNLRVAAASTGLSGPGEFLDRHFAKGVPVDMVEPANATQPAAQINPSEYQRMCNENANRRDVGR